MHTRRALNSIKLTFDISMNEEREKKFQAVKMRKNFFF